MISFLFNVTQNRSNSSTNIYLNNNNNTRHDTASSNNNNNNNNDETTPLQQQDSSSSSFHDRLNIDQVISEIGWSWSIHGKLLTATALLFLVNSIELTVLHYRSMAEDALTTNNYHDDYHIAAAGLVGAMLGAVIWGKCADVLGRRIVALAVSCCITVFAILSAVWCSTTTSATTRSTAINDDDDNRLIQGLLLSRALVGFGLGGVTVPYDLLSEWLPNKSTIHACHDGGTRTFQQLRISSSSSSWFQQQFGLQPPSRGQTLLLVHSFWSFGTLATYGLVETHIPWLSPLKGQLTGVELWWCAVPAVMATAVLSSGMLLESPRWYLAQGNHAKALSVLNSAAKFNGKEHFLSSNRIVLYANESPSLPTTTNMVLCSCTWLRLASALLCIYFGQAFCYQGTAIMLIQTFAQDQHDQRYQALLSALCELVVIVLLVCVVDWWGRIVSQIVAYGLAALACLTLAVWYSLPFLENGSVLIALTFVARMLVFGGGCTTWISTSEILPTSSRGTGHALAAGIFGRAGTFCSTVVLPVVHDIPTLALVVFGGCLWIALAAGDVPETRMNEMGLSFNLLGHSERSWASYRGFLRR